MMKEIQTKVDLGKIARLIRHDILTMTTNVGSGHPSSSLSAVELMVGLLFGGTFRFDADHPDHLNNDRLLFSKGHASPLFYSLWVAAGKLSRADLLTYRRFGSALEGHPTASFRFAEAATGSLGQGLSIGLGLALNAKLDKLTYRTYVLLGDSEMAEGSVWEAMAIAAHYRLDNLVAVVDVNRLGQRGETMYGHDLDAYRRRADAFAWHTMVIDGHDLEAILNAYRQADQYVDRPVMIIARTIKGKGVSFIEDKNGWHGKTLNKEELDRALAELGEVDEKVRGFIPLPHDLQPDRQPAAEPAPFSYAMGEAVATRKAYGNALNRLFPAFPDMISLDGEVSNSTMAEYFKKEHADRFFEMYIAEQNMAGAAIGFAGRGKIPFVSTFAAFMSRAYDQIRMSQYSDANIKFVGSHAGVSIGLDGPSQMGLEDIAFFRTIISGVVFYPCDAVSTEKLVAEAARHRGIVYLRTTREDTPVLYEPREEFPIGGCKVLRQSDADRATLVAAGITVYEALAAGEELQKEGIAVRVIDLYCIKPVDEKTLREAAAATGLLITVEDHVPEGGLGEAVRSALWNTGARVASLAVRKKPKSGKPRELLDFEEISARAIADKVRELAGEGGLIRQENPLIALQQFGQSIWLDYLNRRMFDSGELARLIAEDGLRGVTSNPAIFQKAIGGSDVYDGAIATLAKQGKSSEEIYRVLVVEDVQRAADLFRPLYDSSDGLHGYVSLEVNPHLASDAEGTVEEARMFWRLLDRPNVFIKVPATKAGLPAIRQLISEGINVNVTLLFGLPRYRKAAEAYLAGINDRISRGEPVQRVASVASFFLSRIDVLLDEQLPQKQKEGELPADIPATLQGQAAIACAKMAYQIYKELYAELSFTKMAEKGARPQRLLWASTSTKNPSYSDVKYVEPLIGPETINTLPQETLQAYRNHGDPANRLQQGMALAEKVMEDLVSLGIDIDLVTRQLEEEGVDKFNQPFDKLLGEIELRRLKALS